MKITNDRIVGLSAMMVGVGSLFVAAYQTHLMRQAQNASALPYLMISLNANETGVYLTLRNGGVGPALVDGVQIRFQSQDVKGDAYDFYIEQKPDYDRAALAVDRVIPGQLIPAGESLQMLGMAGRDRVAFLNELLRLFEIAAVPRNWLTNAGIPLSPSGRAVLEVRYSSVYGDRWRVRSDRFIPERF
jgi:hypothetical protein